jgi:hypothetical protein
MAARAEHHGRVWQPEPMVVVYFEIANQFSHKCIPFASHHESDRKTGRVCRRCDEAKSSERPQRSRAFEIHVENDTFDNY